MTPGVPFLLQLLHGAEWAQLSPWWSAPALQPQAGKPENKTHTFVWMSSRQQLALGQRGKGAGPAGSGGREDR